MKKVGTGMFPGGESWLQLWKNFAALKIKKKSRQSPGDDVSDDDQARPH